MTRIWAEKFVCMLLTLGLVWANSWPTVVQLYIVLGHGHFLTAYFHQWKAGKVTWGSLLRYLAWALLIVGAYTRWPDYRVLVAFTTIYFLLHMLWDEQYLLQLPLNLRAGAMHLGRTLEMAPIVLLFSARVLDDMFALDPWHTVPFMRAALPGCGLVTGLYILLIAMGRLRPDYKSAYLLGWGLALLLASLSDWYYRIPTGKVTGFIIIYHYLIWYLHYYLSLPVGTVRQTYLGRVMILNAVVLAAYFVWGAQGPGRWVFQNDWFYVWTLLHLITSTRLADLSNLGRLPVRDV